MRIIIGAAAGNIGHRVAEHVVQAGAEAVLLVRSPAKIPPALAARAQVVPVDLTDTAAVTAAAQGADALFWLVPPNLSAPDWQQWYQAIGAAGAAAVRTNGIARVVLVSSLGAGMAPGLSTVSYIGDTERQFNDTEANVVALRPGYFMENLLMQAEAIRAQGVIAYPYAEDHAIPWVSAADIAAAAAHYLLHPTWAGQWTRNLMGPASLTLPQCAAIIAEVLGRPVRYQRQTEAEVRQGLAAFGASPHAQDELLALFRALGDPTGAYATPRTPEARTKTSLRDFVRQWP